MTDEAPQYLKDATHIKTMSGVKLKVDGDGAIFVEYEANGETNRAWFATHALVEALKVADEKSKNGGPFDDGAKVIR